MNTDTIRQLLPILRQKSTIAGLVGLVTAIFAMFGGQMTPEMAANVSQVLLALISIIAIAVQPKPAGGKYGPHDFREGDTVTQSDGTLFELRAGKWTRLA